MAYTIVQQVRLEVADFDPSFPILSDTDYEYFLTKNNNNVTRAAIDAARTILLVLSQRTDESVDIFSIRGGKAAEQYRLSLQMFLRDPTTNPVLQNCQGWVGGISKEDIAANYQNLDNHVVTVPSQNPIDTNPPTYF
jgi:hypothetical protein